VAQVRSVAERFCTVGSIPIVTGTYEWGPWVNGGAWIQTPVGKVDFLYRMWTKFKGLLSYFGETFICVPLHDPEGEIARLKKSVTEYPAPLKNRIVQESLWGAEFSLRFSRAFGNSADVYNTVGCMTRVAQFLVHAVFALNEEYLVSDKYAGQLLEQFAWRPRDFTPRTCAFPSWC